MVVNNIVKLMRNSHSEGFSPKNLSKNCINIRFFANAQNDKEGKNYYASILVKYNFYGK